MNPLQINVVLEHSITWLYKVVFFLQFVLHFIWSSFIVVEDNTNRVGNRIVAIEQL